MIVKVCGMRDADNIREVSALAVDWMGFIFYPQSPRFVSVKSVLNTVSPSVKKIGVFVNAANEQINGIARECGLDFIQLHGNESTEQCRELKEAGLHIIKAFSVRDAEDLNATTSYEGIADYFLFDTKCSGYGGSGKQFDWAVLTAYTGNTPFILSGGIQPDSIEAIRHLNHPRFAGIDLNSGFEIKPAQKDSNKLKEFINQLKR